nr:MAP7 domain-containing protein 1-like [Aegilops tauschii subsp. strangulata]
MPQSDKGWSRAELTDERASSVLEQMKADLKPGNLRAAKVTGAMLLRGFLTLRVAPLQARVHPLWRLEDEEDKILLSPKALPDDELSTVLRLLVGDNQEYPPSAFVPLFRRTDWEQIVTTRPTFDARGLVPPAPTGLLRRRSRPLSTVKRRKEDAAAVPPSAEKGGDGTCTSPARSPSRGQEEHRREESAPVGPLAPEVPVPGSVDEAPKAQEALISQALVTTPPPPPVVPLAPGSSASSIVLERVLSEMAQLREDLLGADPRLVAGSLELASGWLQSDAAIRATLNQAATASEKEKRAAAQAAADREAALKVARAAHDRCRALERELKGLRDKRAEEARCRRAKEEEMRAWEDAIKNRDAELGELAKTQAAERGLAEELERKVEAKKVNLDARAKVLAEDHVAFSLLEERSRVALKSLYEKGLEKPLTTEKDGPAQLLPFLVKALEEVVEGVGPMAEAEARVLSSVALTRVFSHLHLRDPSARLDELLEPIPEEHCAATATAVQGQVEALLKKFRGFTLAPSTGSATDPAAPSGGAGEGDATKEGAPLVGDGGVQG